MFAKFVFFFARDVEYLGSFAGRYVNQLPPRGHWNGSDLAGYFEGANDANDR